ncbi:hypothetical protein NET02_05665 [Thermomicrobiaceae bacterium CFH 74404]|uniref:Uncharacterized protein n=2 Tax=Thermomicrobia TaxID=189775 RepID=A0AA41WFT9_9BACT|nr:hypothetical protein [Thermalbibacter longus]MCM8748626.1 hypothetical protein [Thermalbibacter longus]
MRTLLRQFFEWYERHYLLNITVAAGLFVLQLAHLYWLTADVVAQRLVGRSYADLEGIFRYLILIVDYTEIPALISVSLVYINELRKRFHWESALYLLFLNSQWLHIFWITDEFVVAEFTGAGHGTSLPLWLAWVAILIDYLELPVIASTIGRFVAALRERRTIQFLREELAD